MRKLLVLLALLCSPAFATTYFVASGATACSGSPCVDSNNGTTKATAWLHPPGSANATGTAASTTPVSGDSVIFRGGDTWHLDATAPSLGVWNVPAHTTGAVVYYGVDLTWFSGGSFARPIFDGTNSLSTTFAASCAHAESGSLIIIGATSTNITWDNFEIRGVCWNTNSSSDGAMLSVLGGATNIIVSNFYCHGWTMTSGASDNFPCITSFGGGTVADNNQYTLNVFDGSDSPHYPAGGVISGSTIACQWGTDANAGVTNIVETSGNVVTLAVNANLTAFLGGGKIAVSGLTVGTWLNNLPAVPMTSASATSVTFTDPTSHGTQASTAETGGAGMAPCVSGQAMNGSHFYNIDHNIFRYVSNMIVTANCHSIHDNLFEFLEGTFSSGTNQQHPNVMNCIGGAASENLYWYNNTMRHTFVTENVYFATRTNLYLFNNVMYDNMNSVFGPLAGVCMRFNTVANSTLPVAGFVYNNTDGDNSCGIKFEVANAPLTQWSGTGTFENNNYGAQASNCVGTCGTNLTAEYICATAGTCTIVNNGTHVFQTSAQQATQGYTSANSYAPGSGAGATVGAGTNATSSCSTFSPGSDLCSGTSLGVSYISGSGGFIANSPAITINARPSGAAVWNAGAFQLVGVLTYVPASLTFNPQALSTTSSGQTVTMTNTGGSTITLTSELLQTGTNFAKSGNTCGASLTTLASCVVTITFTPLSANTLTDNLVVTSSDAGSPVSVPLSGIGLATPVISPVTGSYSGAQTTTITDSTTGASIFYTLDGSMPSAGSTAYSGSFLVSTTTTVKAIAILSGQSSGVNTSIITITGTNNNLTTTINHVVVQNVVID